MNAEAKNERSASDLGNKDSVPAPAQVFPVGGGVLPSIEEQQEQRHLYECPLIQYE